MGLRFFSVHHTLLSKKYNFCFETLKLILFFFEIAWPLVNIDRSFIISFPTLALFALCLRECWDDVNGDFYFRAFRERTRKTMKVLIKALLISLKNDIWYSCYHTEARDQFTILASCIIVKYIIVHVFLMEYVELTQ